MKKVRGVSKGIEVRASKIFSKPVSKHSPFDDANVELTFNLLKIRPEEEVRRASQTNSAFFEELSSTSKLQ